MQIRCENCKIWLGNSDFQIQRDKVSQNAPVATNEHDLLLALILQPKVPSLFVQHPSGASLRFLQRGRDYAISWIVIA